MTELESLLTLNAVAGLGGIRIRKLFAYFGSFTKILSAKPRDLKAVEGIPGKVMDAIARFDQEHFLKEENRLMKSHGVSAVGLNEQGYPGLLKDIPDAPAVLYIKGALSEHSLAVAVVGSRRASLYGVSVAEKFSRQLSELGIAVVSGMARGIDTSAHRGALAAGGQTVAVLGNGLSIAYPPENKKLFEDIALTGAVVSEFPMATPPAAANFPRRNRIISGLSLGVIVVEAAKRSGALITSRMALEQGREVFAVPGKVDNPNSQGTHELIKQGAKLVHSIEDVLEELAVPFKQRLNEARKGLVAKDLNPEEMNIFSRVAEPVHIDELAAQSGCSPSAALSVLLKLELKHLVKQLPGKIFVQSDSLRHN